MSLHPLASRLAVSAVLLGAAIAVPLACRTPAGAGGDASATLDANDPIYRVSVNQSFGHGQSYAMAVDPSREIDEVTVTWDTQYSIVMRDAQGHVLLNDEGQPKYKDGMYAYGKIDNGGALHEIAPKKFVAPGETDNWHDLQGVRGSRLVIEFWFSHEASNDPQVLATHRQVLLRSVQIRYKDAPGQTYKDFVFNSSYNDALSSSARYVQAGGKFELPIDDHLNVYRVDVRWGDAKPRVNGVYVAGAATGRVKFNGAWQGGPRNVAMIETQTWTGLQYPAAVGGHHTLVVTFENDDARVHSVRVYYH